VDPMLAIAEDKARRRANFRNDVALRAASSIDDAFPRSRPPADHFRTTKMVDSAKIAVLERDLLLRSRHLRRTSSSFRTTISLSDASPLLGSAWAHSPEMIGRSVSGMELRDSRVASSIGQRPCTVGEGLVVNPSLEFRLRKSPGQIEETLLARQRREEFLQKRAPKLRCPVPQDRCIMSFLK
jgi:hypothetical protein